MNDSFEDAELNINSYYFVNFAGDFVYSRIMFVYGEQVCFEYHKDGVLTNVWFKNIFFFCCNVFNLCLFLLVPKQGYKQRNTICKQKEKLFYFQFYVQQNNEAIT